MCEIGARALHDYVIRFRGNICVTSAEGETRRAAYWVGVSGRARKLGGHVRVGKEDNLYLSKRKLPRSNAEMVARMARTMAELDLEPAPPAEARQMLSLRSAE